jgi:hypothetical protein
MMRCPVMQLSATVEGMDITDRQAAGTARAIHLTVNDREYILGPIRRKARAAGGASGSPQRA